MQITIECDYCKRQFHLSKTIYNKRRKRNIHIYCSRQCAAKARMTLQKFTCFKCGKTFYRQPLRNLKSKSGKIFCSRSCSNSYTNTFRFKTSINTYRRIAFEKLPHKCNVCGWNDDERILEVHHIDENRKNNNIENLIILCPICHRYLTLHLKTLDEMLSI